jgi:hypothetical protein
MSNNEKKDLGEMTVAEIAALDLQADKKHDVNGGPLLKVKPVLSLRTNVRAAASIVGLARN